MTHTLAPAPVREPKTTVPQDPHHRTRRSLFGWAFIGAGLIAAVVVTMLIVTSGPSPQPVQPPNGSLINVPRSPDIAERWLAHHSDMLRLGVPQSADQAERYLAEHGQPTRPAGVPGSADQAERYLRGQEVAGAPGR